MTAYCWLLPSVTTTLLRADLLVLLDAKFLRFRTSGEAILGLVERLDGNFPEDQIDLVPGLRTVFDLLDAERWIVRLARPIDELRSRYPRKTRQLSYCAHLQRDEPDRAFAQLAAARVAIVGVGGVGSHVAQSLAGSGIEHLVLVDPDTIDESNLNRQFFYTTADLGAYKAERAAEHLRRRFPDLDVACATEAWCDHTPRLAVMADVDLVVFAGDSPTVNRDAAAGIGTTPFVCGGYLGARGIVGPLVWPTRDGSCWLCTLESMNDQPLMEAMCSGTVERATAWNPSGATVNGIVGNLLAEVAMRALAPALGPPPLASGERLVIDMATLAIAREPIAVQRRACGHVATRRSA